MKLLKIMSAFLVLIIASCSVQIKNSITENVKIYGNCGMCEKTIESAGNKSKLAHVDWNKETQIASISYDKLKTSKQEILKRIALAGYDSDDFLAPDDTYATLPGCCQYERAKAEVMVAKQQDDNAKNSEMAQMDHTDAVRIAASDSKASEVSKEIKSQPIPKEMEVITNPFQSVYDDYFSLKDALIRSDALSASKTAANLLHSINTVKMNDLEMDVHMVWMKMVGSIKTDIQAITESDNIDIQRNSFIALSENIYTLMKVSVPNVPTYYQHCPMANNGKGANWLSKENAVKNPYYGSSMLTCGKTVETIK